MVKSALLKVKRIYPALIGASCGFMCLGFKFYTDKLQVLFWSNRCLIQAYDSSGESRIKNWSLNITDDSFLRLRKIFYNGRQEYFSFNLHRFNDMSYIGNDSSGTIRLQTKADDIIVQTYNDPSGNIDSMSSVLNLPVRNMNSGQLDSLHSALLYLKSNQ